MDKLNTQFAAASGSAQTAARDLQFVRDISASLGLSFTESAAGFAKFSASVRGTSIEGEQVRKVFTGVAKASTALRLSADETNGILLAFSQMMGKGRILSAELMTNFGPALSSLYGAAAQEAANSPVAQLNRMKNALFKLAAAIVAGPMQAVGNLAAAFTNLAEAAKSGLAWLMQPATGGGASAFAEEGLRTIAAVVTAVVAGLANSERPIYRADGGWIPGVGNADTVPARLTPGEYVIKKSASAFWGGGLLNLINNPFNTLGRELKSRLSNIGQALPVPVPIPRMAYATGGAVVAPQQQPQAAFNITINTTERVDADLIRRKIIPELERYQRRTS